MPRAKPILPEWRYWPAVPLIALLALAVVQFDSSRSQTPSQPTGATQRQNAEQSSIDKNPSFFFEVGEWIDANHNAIEATSAVLLFFITGILGWIAWRQLATTRDQLRAHVAAVPGGVETTTTGGFVGHIIFRNVGETPAYDFVSPPPRIVIAADSWEPPRWSSLTAAAGSVLPAKTEDIVGSAGLSQADIDACPAASKFIYVWGRITYTDGFGRYRYTNFCHRYPWARRETITGGEVRIAKKYGRRNDKGNEAN